MDVRDQHRTTDRAGKVSRRAAEKAARELMRERATMVGDLAVAATNRTAAAEAIEDARREGAALVREAEAKAAALLDAAQQHAQSLDAVYAQQYATATTGGWTDAELRLLGYEASTGPRRARATTRGQAHLPMARAPQDEADTGGEN